MPAEIPPTSRAMKRTESEGAYAARRQAGTERVTPRTSIIFRPYRSPIAPNHNTDAARPSEYPTATRSSDVCDESKALPMSGRATLATARFRFATAATRTSATSTRPERAGASDFASALAVAIA